MKPKKRATPPLYKIWVQPVIEKWNPDTDEYEDIEKGEPVPVTLYLSSLEEARAELTEWCTHLESYAVNTAGDQ